MGKQIKIDFYRIQMPPDIGRFESLIQRVNDLPEDDSRTADIKGLKVRLQTCLINNQMITGEMIRIRMDEMPIKVSLDGQIGLIDLDEDEGIGEETAFLYNTRLRILVIQRNVHSVSSHNFIRYFESLGHLDRAINIDPIFQAEAIEKLHRMTMITKFDVTFAGLDRFDFLDSNKKKSVSAIIDVGNQLSAPYITMTASMGHIPGSLNINEIKHFIANISHLFDYRSKPIRKLIISGKEVADGQSDVFDLLEYKMVEKADIDLDNDRRLPYQRRIGALNRAWINREVELSMMFN